MSKAATLCLFLTLVACAGNITPSRQIDDAVVSANVRDALRQDSMLMDFDISVDVRGGEVSLTGVVRTEAQRERASSVAQSVAGVTAVKNLLATR